MPPFPSAPYLRLNPRAEETAQWLSGQEQAACTYSPHGGTRTTESIPGYIRDRYEIQIGTGKECFERARAAVRDWVMFDLGWTRMLVAPRPPREGALAAVAIRFGLWWVNSCRIVYVEDQPTCYAFAYGTLPGHVEAGEERFSAELRADGGVWFAIDAFSRPRHPLTWLGYPLVRRLQRRFGRLACERIRREVAGRAS